jgi:hypothetical protein
MSKNLAPVLLLALAAVAGLAIWLGGSREVGGGHESRSGNSSTSAQPDAAHPELSAAAIGDESEATSARRTAAELAPDPVGAPPSPAPAATDATLLVRVASKTTGAPLARIRMNLFRTDPNEGEGSTDVPVSTGSLVEAPITGDDGRVQFAVPSGIACTVWAHAEDNQAGVEFVKVPELRAEERRELTIELPTGFDLHFVAKVVRDGDRKPIAGARARVVRSDGVFTSEGPTWKSVVISETSTGPDGLLDLSLESWRRAHVRVEADGFGMALVVPVRGHETPETAWIVPLYRGATLDARVLDAAGSPFPGAAVRLSTRGYELNRPGREESVDGWIDLPETDWTGAVGPDGRSVLRDLPPQVRLAVEIRAGENVLRRDAESIELEPGQVLEREWRIGTGCTLLGLALDAAELPVPALEIWLTKAYSEHARYFDWSERSGITSKAVTDADGRFRLEDVQAGKWYVGPAASTPYGEPAAENGSAAFAVPIEIAGSGSQEITLRVHRGLFIRGKILDARGGPAESANVHASIEGADWGPQVDSGKGGEFKLGPLAPGRFLVVADGVGGDASSEAVLAEAGAKDVVLRLRPGSKLRGRVVDRRTGESSRAEVMLMPEVPGAGIFGRGLGLRTKDDGTFEVEGLEPGRYGLAARTDDGRFGALPGVDLAAGTASDEIALPVSEGGRLKVRYEGASERAWLRVLLSGVPVDWGNDLERGKTVERTVPAGTMVLELVAEPGTQPITRNVSLAAGEEREVLLSDRR